MIVIKPKDDDNLDDPTNPFGSAGSQKAAATADDGNPFGDDMVDTDEDDSKNTFWEPVMDEDRLHRGKDCILKYSVIE